MKFRHPLMVLAMILPCAAAWPVLSTAAQAADTADSTSQTPVAARFSESERQIVEKYFGKMPAGLAATEALPPGVATRDLPADLEEQLPPPPAGYERRIAGDSAVVLIDPATGKIADIIKDILIPGADD